MNKFSILLFALFTCTVSFSQVAVNQLFSNSPELIIKFQIQDKSELAILTRIVSIDKVEGNEVTAYTNPKRFEQFLTLNIPYEIVEKQVLTPEYLNTLDPEAFKNFKNDWNSYPNYQQYLDLMNDFANDYPDICRLVEFGTSIENRKLLCCVISANVGVREAEPQVFFNSSMHGDELTGYVLMLRYIEYLLTNYGTNERITHLLDNMEIWINPLANPDGTFWNGDNSVSGAKRYNKNWVDLNRNYYDWYIQGYDEGPEQKETTAFCNLQANENFTLAMNIHGGAEVCNYPWDNNYTPTIDDAWWQFVCKEYADTVFAHAPPNYLKTYPSGYVRGCDWYVVYSGRQDYANYYNHNREFCLEISNSKTPNGNNLPNYWNYNYRSFLNYTQQALYGIHGVVTDACTGDPVYAKITIPQDNNGSFVMTDPRVGYYARPIKGGTYSVTYSADGYEPQTVSVTISDKQQVIQNIALAPEGIETPVAGFEADKTILLINETVQFTDKSENATDYLWYFEGGTPETSNEKNPVILYNNPGKFDVKLTVSNPCRSDSLWIDNYIIVKEFEESPVANFTADKTQINQNETVTFTDLSENATAWEWFFEGGTPETSAEQNPTILYANEGSFTVILTVSNEFGNDEMIKENYIVVNKIAVNEIDALKMKVFPNPVSINESLTIETDAQLLKIEWVNLLGKTVKTLYPKTNAYTFPVSCIERGFYFLKLETEKGVFVAKVQVY